MEATNSPVEAVGNVSTDHELIEEEALDAVAPPERLAGVGAALGSCFSLMLVILTLGSAGSLAVPQSGRAAQNESRNSTPAPPLSDAPEPPPSRPATAPDHALIESLERAALLARTELEAAELQFALRRSDTLRAALERAEDSRARAEQVESEGSPYAWLPADQLAHQTRDRGLSKLGEDLSTLREQRAKARLELDRLRIAAHEAQAALDRARDGSGDAPSVSASAGPHAVSDPIGASTGPRELPEPSDDLRSLIDRHRAALLGTRSAGVVD